MNTWSMCLDQGQTEGVSSLPHHVERGLNTGGRAWWQVFFPEPVCRLLHQTGARLASQCLSSSPQLPVIEQS